MPECFHKAQKGNSTGKASLVGSQSWALEISLQSLREILQALLQTPHKCPPWLLLAFLLRHTKNGSFQWMLLNARGKCNYLRANYEIFKLFATPL